jgi:chorismate mutase
MTAATAELVGEVLAVNDIAEEAIVSIVFSQTGDLSAENPARALRRSGYAGTPLFCTSEPAYPDSLPRTLRVLVTFEQESRRAVRPVYLGGARALRPDLTDTGS